MSDLIKMAEDLYKRLGGVGNKDARIVRALIEGQSQWISVKTRPKKDDEYLCYVFHSGDWGYSGPEYKREVCKYYKGSWIVKGTRHSGTALVKLWLPLPQPPKAE